jgi:uncharacterized protein YndB with AHSA1/START domain
MTTLLHEVRVEAPVDAVWRAVSDLLAVQLYNPMVASVRHLSELREGVGAARRCDLEPKGWIEERVWDWVPGRAIGLEVSASEWPLTFMKWRTELQDEGGTTLVSQKMSYRLKFGPLGVLVDALMMRRKLDRAVRDLFGNLKRYVEALPR